MAEHRPFPPSARRRALAHAAGLTAASPIVVGAAAWIGALVAVLVFGRAVAARLGALVTAACSRAATPSPASPTSPGFGTGVVSEVLTLVAPCWSRPRSPRSSLTPRRPGACGSPAASSAALRRSSARACSMRDTACSARSRSGRITFAWLWAIAPRLGALVQKPAAGALLLVGFVATLGAAWVALGAVEALMRHADLARSLRMTAAEKREDERLAGADPRWRRRRAEVGREPRQRDVRDAVAGASVVLLADGLAVAIAWDPVRRPVPVRTASGRDARATQLLALARRHGIAVLRDPDLARALAGGIGPVPEAHWARLAEIIAATSRRGTSI
ncbi:MAG: EscU/YscU/HrcU family type III secretion system export apparatus switch protein [Myxococcales bacterium]|nr:EscU/YscU/HrcU family type III secretion system export apparatus switch protein [Myxococcales bacterium]